MTNEYTNSLEKALRLFTKKSRLGIIMYAVLTASFLVFITNICFHINTLTYYISVLIASIILAIVFRTRHHRNLKRRAIMLPTEDVSVYSNVITILTADDGIECHLRNCLMTQSDNFLYIRPMIDIYGEKLAPSMIIIELPDEEQRLYYKSLRRLHHRKYRVQARWLTAIFILLILFFLLSKLDLYYLQKLAYFITSHGKI